MNDKRAIAILAAAAFLLCGCDAKPRTDQTFNTSQTANQSQEDGGITPVSAADDTLTTQAKIEPMTPPGGSDIFYTLQKMDSGYFAVSSENYRESYTIHTYDDMLENHSQVELAALSPYDGYYPGAALFSVGEDAIRCLTIMENHSNMEPFQEGDDVESFDFDKYNSTWESEYYLCTYTLDGTLSSKVQIKGLEQSQDANGYDRFNGMYCEGDLVYLTFWDNDTIVRINPDGTLTETYTGDNGEIIQGMPILKDRDGKPFRFSYSFTGRTAEDYGVEISISEFDAQSGKPGEAFFTTNDISYADNMLSGGCGDYRCFINTESQLMGIRDDGTAETVIDWDASDLPVMSVIPMADGSFLGKCYQENFEGTYHIERKHASEISETKTITIGMLGYNYIKDWIQDFNRSQSEYHIDTIIYKNSDGSDYGGIGKDDAVDKLKMDVISDNAPDVIVMDGMHELFLTLGSRSVFADLYTFMAEDPDVNSSTIVPNYLTAMQHPSGKLYSLSPTFHIISMAVKEKYDAPENWTVDDMIALYDGADDIFYHWSTKEDALRMFLTGTDFTDEIAGTCRFDSPEFIKILEFCDRYPAVSTCPAKNYEDEAQMRLFDQWHTDHYLRFQNDQDYLFPTDFSGVSRGFGASTYAYTKADLGGAFSLVGYPSDNGQGGKISTQLEMGILSTCPDKERAWEVLKAFVSGESMNIYEHQGYPIFDDAFETALDDEMYIWNGGTERTDAEYFEDDSDVYPLTQEERDNLEDYIRHCQTYMMLDDDVETIVMEEAEMYFSGDRSAEDTAKMIQSRAQIMLSEQS